MRRGSAAVRREPLWLFAPLFCSAVLLKTLSFGVHRRFGPHHLLIEFALVVLLCVPLGLAAEAVVARLLLTVNEGERPDWVQVREILRAPGLARVTLALVGLTVWCLLLAGLLLFLWVGFGVMTRAFFFGMAHPGVKVPPAHSAKFVHLLAFTVIDAAVLSRYSFVLPVFAVTRRWEQGLVKKAVALAKRAFVPLAVLSMVEYVLVFCVDHATRPLMRGGLLTAAITSGVSAVMTSALATWFEVVKAGLAFQRLGLAARAVDASSDPARVY